MNGELWDLDRALEGDATVALLKWDSDEAKAVFWHSSAHMLGEAMEKTYGGCLCYGPPIKPHGFYYDMYVDADVKISQDHFKVKANTSEMGDKIGKLADPGWSGQIDSQGEADL